MNLPVLVRPHKLIPNPRVSGDEPYDDMAQLTMLAKPPRKRG